MKKQDIKIGEKYRIIYSDRYRGKVGTAFHVDHFGDVIIIFKNNNTVRYHATWLEEA